MSETTAESANTERFSPMNANGDLQGFEQLLDKHGGELDIFEDDAPLEDAPTPDTSAAAPHGPGEDDGEGGSPNDDDTPKAEASGDDDDASEQDAEDDGMEAAEVATLLGLDEGQVDISEDGALLVRYKVEGEEGTATLPELIKGYQLEKYVTRRSEQLAERGRELSETHAQAMGQAQGQLQQALAIAEALKGRALVRYDNVDWDKLQQEDPGRYAAMQLGAQQEMAGLNAEVNQLMQAQHQMVQQQHEQSQAANQQWLAEQQQLLFEHVPELGNAETRGEILDGYHQYLTEYGFSDEEIRGTLDHRLLRVVNDAYAYRKAKAAAPDADDPKKVVAKKRVLRTPKIARVGRAATPADAPTRRKANANKRMRTSGSPEDAVAFALESGLADSLL